MSEQRSAQRIGKIRHVRLMNSPMSVTNGNTGGISFNKGATHLLPQPGIVLAEFTQLGSSAERRAPLGAVSTDEPWTNVDPTVHLPIY